MADNERKGGTGRSRRTEAPGMMLVQVHVRVLGMPRDLTLVRIPEHETAGHVVESAFAQIKDGGVRPEYPTAECYTVRVADGLGNCTPESPPLAKSERLKDQCTFPYMLSLTLDPAHLLRQQQQQQQHEWDEKSRQAAMLNEACPFSATHSPVSLAFTTPPPLCPLPGGRERLGQPFSAHLISYHRNANSAWSKFSKPAFAAKPRRVVAARSVKSRPGSSARRRRQARRGGGVRSSTSAAFCARPAAAKKNSTPATRPTPSTPVGQRPRRGARWQRCSTQCWQRNAPARR
eukprot:Rhum_TRINITY_DN11727_c0_g1::Rhum_TRINITY_DN11727_c0_g1_i1::g.46490::m.46490